MDAHGPAVTVPPPQGEGILETAQALAGARTAPAAPEVEEHRGQAALAPAPASVVGSPLISAPQPGEGDPSGSESPYPAPVAQAPVLVQLRDAGLRYVQRQLAPKQYALGFLLASLSAIGVELAVNVPFLGTGITLFFLRWVIRLIGAACLFGGWRATRQPLMKWWGWGVITGLLLAVLLLLYLRARFGLTTY
jgi:hypothetical protein